MAPLVPLSAPTVVELPLRSRVPPLRARLPLELPKAVVLPICRMPAWRLVPPL